MPTKKDSCSSGEGKGRSAAHEHHSCQTEDRTEREGKRRKKDGDVQCTVEEIQLKKAFFHGASKERLSKKIEKRLNLTSCCFLGPKKA